MARFVRMAAVRRADPRAWVLLIALVLAFAPSAGWAQAASEPLTIETTAGPKRFDVEVARSEPDRQQGLMYRHSMADTHGMLFDFAEVAPVSMWMQNTYLSLDMVFIRPDGTISRIAERTEPLSTRIIPSGEPVLSVLELVAGAARKFGIKAGDRVVHPLFKPR